jgi:hypothetical protein
MQHDQDARGGRSLLSNRAAEIIVALVLLAFSAIVIYDSVRIGFSWVEGEGPASGYFPFYMAVLLAIASLVNLIIALLGRGTGEVFVAVRPFGRVLAVLVPSIIFVGLIGYFGIYVSAALFIFAFMVLVGRRNPFQALAIGVAAPVFLFLMFEVWFLVPLPKGPLEAWLGY